MPKQVNSIPGRKVGGSAYRALFESLEPGTWELTEEDVPEGVLARAFANTLQHMSRDYSNITVATRNGRIFVQVEDA